MGTLTPLMSLTIFTGTPRTLTMKETPECFRIYMEFPRLRFIPNSEQYLLKTVA